MESKVNTIDLGTTEAFKRKFPHLAVKNPRWAEGNITQEHKNMKIGDVVIFPLDRYNYNTIRNIPYTALGLEIVNGWSFSSKLDRPNKSAAVIRTA